MSGAPARRLHVQEVQFIDREGFERPLLAATMMAPAGWRHQAILKWTQARCGLPYYMEMQAQSANGPGMMSLHRGESWSMASTPLDDGCRHANLTTAEQYLRDWVQRNRPGARWLAYRLRPERSSGPQQMGYPGMTIRQWTEAGQALIGYAVDGRPVRETIETTVHVVTSQSTMGAFSAQTLNAEAKGVLAWRAPEGQLDFDEIDVLRKTIKFGYEWSTRIEAGLRKMALDDQKVKGMIANIYGQIGAETIRHMAQRGEDARISREQIYSAWNAGVAARESADDRMHRERIRAVREVEHYSDPTRPSGVAELPNHFRHAWGLRDGSYVLTDDPNFDPNRDLRIEGRLLRLAPR